MVRGLGSEQCPRYKALCELEAVEHTPGDPRSMSYIASYQNKHLISIM